MNGPQFFGAIVRGLGLYWVTWGVTYLPLALVAHPNNTFTATHYIVIGSVDIIVGLILMLNSDGMVAFCYPKPDAEEEPAEAES